jgi:ligand-binding SRPBCC domain-containing protein
MSVSICPIAIIQAPLERVWEFLSEPTHYASWWDAQTLAINPQGHAQPGQRIEARSRAFGKWWKVRVTVETVDEIRHQIFLTTQLPFGITVLNHISCRELDSRTCQVSFG